jgi:hypothetical protein
MEPFSFKWEPPRIFPDFKKWLWFKWDERGSFGRIHGGRICGFQWQIYDSKFKTSVF